MVRLFTLLIVAFPCISHYVSSQNTSVVMGALESLFVSTNGLNWRWKNESTVGKAWNFTKDCYGNYYHDPCDNWQGICCAKQSLNCSTLLEAIENFDDTPILLDTANATTGEVIGILLPAMGLSGTIPPDFFNISSLLLLLITHNRMLVGNLPPQISQLTQLQYLYSNNNYLDGTIPEISGLKSLRLVSLYKNQFSGSFPQISGMPELFQIAVYENRLEGTISALWGLPSLANLVLYKNNFHGQLPPFDDLPALFELVANNNFFDGTIPSFDHNPGLTQLNLCKNYLFGTIPELSGLTNLTILAVQSNLLEGTMPSVSQLTLLEEIITYSNYLHGHIPSISGLSLLSYLDIYSNLLSGPLPALDGLDSMTNIDVNSNFITGTLPSSLFSLGILNILCLNDNHLSGSLSADVVNFSILNTLNLQMNSFTGTLPSTLLHMTTLSTLVIHGNMFIGPVQNLFPSLLVSLDISDNNFSGSLPMDIFRFPNLTNIALVKNCFSGQLSDDMCGASALKSLSLDGLSSGDYCETPLLPVTHTYTVSRYIDGSVPPCLYQLSSLRSLQLSGNGLTGTLPGEGEFVLSSSLRNLSLSHNRLSGTIPRAFQSHDYDVLDLSYNKLSGEITDMSMYFTEVLHEGRVNITKKQLILQVNRLSGLIPTSFRTVENIEIVSGNLFGCGSDLPTNDPGTPEAQCGSMNLNIGLGIWIGLFAAFLGIILVSIMCLHGTSNGLFRDMVEYYECSSVATVTTHNLTISSLTSTLSYLDVSNQVVKICIILSFCAVAMFLPIQLCLKFMHNESYSTHLFQYGYAPSFAFVSSFVTALLVLLSGIVLMTIIWFAIWHATMFQTAQRSLHNYSTAPTAMTSTSITEISLWTLYIIVDVIAMVAVNSGYLYVALYKSQHLIYLAQAGLVAFKITWNMKVLPFGILQVENRLARGKGTIATGMMMGWLMMFNNILAPILVTICSQSDCFLNVIIAAEPITVLIEYSGSYTDTFTLIDKTVGVYLPEFEELSFEPPFIYSFQCSSSLITYYVPMYVMMYTYLTFISPLLTMAILYLQAKYGHVPGVATWLDELGCGLMRPGAQVNEASVEVDKNERQRIALFDGRKLSAVMICHTATLMTFGLGYPLLAILICLAVLVETLQWRLLIGRYLHYVAASGSSNDKILLTSQLERSCEGVSDMLRQSRWLLIVGMSLFFSLFLLDMAGDKAKDDWVAMMWPPVVMLIWPMVIILFEQILLQFTMLHAPAEHTGSERGLSMTPSFQDHNNDSNKGIINNNDDTDNSQNTNNPLTMELVNE